MTLLCAVAVELLLFTCRYPVMSCECDWPSVVSLRYGACALEAFLIEEGTEGF